METKQLGRIVLQRHGLLQTYTCTCGAGACEADEGGYYCIEELGGCGATLRRGGEQ